VLFALTRPASGAVRSTLAVILTLTAAAVVEAGVFAAGHADRLVERDLLFALPSLFVGFSAWLGYGAPRPRWRTIGISVAVFAALVALPIGALATSDALTDNPSLVPLIHVTSPQAYGLTALAAGVALVLLVWLPRRHAWLLPVVIGAVLLAVSISASREFAHQSRIAQRTLVGRTPDWVDRATTGPAEYLYDGGTAWNLAWMQLLRNERLAGVVDMTATPLPGPLQQSQLRVLGDDGTLRLVDGTPLPTRMLVAPDGVRLDGRPLARKRGTDGVPGLVLWELRTPRVKTWAQGLLPNGDVGPGGTASLDVFDCGRGTFHLSAVGRDNTMLTLSRGSTTVATYKLWPHGVWDKTIQTPAGGRRCTFSLSSSSLVHLDEFDWTPAH